MLTSHVIAFIMKTTFRYLLVVVLFSVFTSISLSAQTQVKTDAQGNYTSVSVKQAKTPDQFTGKYFIDKDGKKYPVYLSVNNKLYYLRIAKTSGREYRVYLNPSKK